jgi:hypothetical protein
LSLDEILVDFLMTGDLDKTMQMIDDFYADSFLRENFAMTFAGALTSKYTDGPQYGGDALAKKAFDFADHAVKEAKKWRLLPSSTVT